MIVYVRICGDMRAHAGCTVPRTSGDACCWLIAAAVERSTASMAAVSAPKPLLVGTAAVREGVRWVRAVLCAH